MKEIYSKLLSDIVWSDFDIAVQQPFVYAEPTKLYTLYITGENAYLATSNPSAPEFMSEGILIGKAKYVGICFDGRWSYQGGVYKYYTIGEPYIATIDNGNRLYVQNGVNGLKLLLTSGARNVKLIRGWKHTQQLDIDQGIVCAYVKNNVIYSREYVQQADKSYVWTPEAVVYKSTDTITKFELFRTLDYRIGFSVHTPSETKIITSERCWIGAAFKDETIATKSEYTVKMEYIPITSRTVDAVAETVKTHTGTQNTVAFSTFGKNVSCYAHNTDNKHINLLISEYLDINTWLNNLGAVVVTDAQGIVYPVIDVTYSYPYFVLNVLDFSNASGNITLTYNGKDIYMPNALNRLDAFSCSFLPVGLTPSTINRPTISTASNVDTEVV